MGSVCSGDERGPIFLLDGSNIAYRAFFALPQDIATSGGFPTNALYGFCLMMIKILGDYHPDAVIVAWDSREKTFRHEEFEEYKAHRKPMPDLLAEQWPYFSELCAAFGFVNLVVPGFEADDILATLARQAEAEGRTAVIVTGDRDALQLAGPHVSIMANTRGVTEVKVYDPAAVEERFGVPPRLIPDLIGLKGDTSDNIPGVPGIGEKTAAQLLAQFGSLEEVLARTDEVAGAKRKELLREHRETALLSKRLALLDHDAPIDIHAAEVQPHQIQREMLDELLTRFEFTSLLERLEPLLAASPSADAGVSEPAGGRLPAPVPPPRDAAAWENLVDRDRPFGLTADEATGGLWLAQPQAGAAADTYESFTLVEMPDPSAQAAVLEPLLAGGAAICHDSSLPPACADWSTGSPTIPTSPRICWLRVAATTGWRSVRGRRLSSCPGAARSPGQSRVPAPRPPRPPRLPRRRRRRRLSSRSPLGRSAHSATRACGISSRTSNCR